MDKYEFQLDKIRAILKAVDAGQSNLSRDDLLNLFFILEDLTEEKA